MANDHSITDFITQFGGGTRLNRFKITGKLGDITLGSSNTDLSQGGGVYYVRSASVPGSQVGGIPINYRGRTVVYPGDRTYSPWNITVLDENPNLYEELRLIIFEADYAEKCNYYKIKENLLKYKFINKLEGHQNVWIKEYTYIKLDHKIEPNYKI